MKKCYKCNVNLNTSQNKCPLCHSDLGKQKNSESVFPNIPTMYKRHNLLYKILSFISLLSVCICITINFLFNGEISWSWFIIAGILSFWLTLTTAIKRRNHFMKMLFMEFNFVIIASLLWDYFTGWHLWSVNFVLPILCITYVIVVFIMRIFFKRYIKDSIFYITLNSFIGLLPILLILFDIVTIKFPSLISIVVCIFMLVLLTVFNRRSLTKELVRRFHI